MNLDTVLKQEPPPVGLVGALMVAAGLGLTGYGLYEAATHDLSDYTTRALMIAALGAAILGAFAWLFVRGKRMRVRDRACLSGPPEEIVWIYVSSYRGHHTLVVAHDSGHMIHRELPSSGGVRPGEAYAPLLEEAAARFPNASLGYTAARMDAFRVDPRSLVQSDAVRPA